MLSEIDLSVGEVVYPPRGRLGPRRQRDVELILVHAGHVDITIDDGPPNRVTAGSAGLLLPGHREHFAFAEDRPTRHSWVQGRSAAANRLARLPAVIPASAALTRLMRAAVTAARSPLPTSTQVTAALANAALWQYIGEAEYRTAAPSNSIQQARDFIHSRLQDPDVDLRAIAAAAHVTPAHLVRRFRVELGVTPVAYRWQQRVAAGVELLTSTGLPVGEIAERTGFRSVYHFSRRVKNRTGVGPTELRRRRWGGR